MKKIVVVEASHLDHNLRPKQLHWLLEQDISAFPANEAGVRIITLELPEELGNVEVGLHGPVMGDMAVTEEQVYYGRRGDREWCSRLVSRAPRRTQELTAIVGPYADVETALFTVYGGPYAPREVEDPALSEQDKLVAQTFWSEHALSDPTPRVSVANEAAELAGATR